MSDATYSIRYHRILFGDFPFGFLIYPFVFTALGAIATSAGFSFGRRGRASYGEEALLFFVIATGAIIAIVAVGSVFRYYWFRSIAQNGQPVEGKVSKNSMQGITVLEYKYKQNGKKYMHRHYAIGLTVPKSIPDRGQTILIVHKKYPRRSYLLELFK